MKLASFDGPAGRRVGIVDGDEIVDLTAADPSLATMTDLLQRGPQAASGNSSSAPRLPLSSVKLAAPVPRPPKFLAIGYNNPQHLEETNTPRPTRQVWFNKQQSCIVGPGDGVWIPRIAPDEVDYEGELGMVIGRRCKNVPNDKAASPSTLTARSVRGSRPPTRSATPWTWVCVPTSTTTSDRMDALQT